MITIEKAAQAATARPLWPIKIKNMRNILLIAILFFSIPVFGQRHFLGLKGGIVWSNINSDNFLSDCNYRIGLTTGLTYDFQINNKYNFGVEMLYAQKGGYIDLIQTNPDGSPTGEISKFEFNFDYLTIPIKGGYTIGNKLSVFINIGLAPSYLIEAKHIIPYISGITESETINVTKKVTKFDIAGMIAIGVNCNISNSILVFLAFDYQKSLTTLTNNEYFSSDKARHFGLTTSTGIKIKLRR